MPIFFTREKGTAAHLESHLAKLGWTGPSFFSHMALFVRGAPAVFRMWSCLCQGEPTCSSSSGPSALPRIREAFSGIPHVPYADVSTSLCYPLSDPAVSSQDDNNDNEWVAQALWNDFTRWREWYGRLDWGIGG